MARLIEARVIQKAGTIEELNNSDLKYYDGEQVFVKSDVDDNVISYKVGANDKKFNELPYPDFYAKGKVTPSSVFTGLPSGVYIPTLNGLYNSSVTVNLADGYQVLHWDGTTLEKVVYPIDFTSVVYGGIIDDTADLSNPTELIWYIASPGTYNTVPPITLTQNSILTWDGNQWSHAPFDLEVRGDMLVADTMAEMRNITPQVASLLTNGTYRGVTLLGYYEKGDTPASIDYFLSDTTVSDDGGSVIEVAGIRLVHDFLGDVDWLYFGASSSIINNIYILNRVCQYAIINNACVYLNSRQVSEFNINISDTTIRINSSFNIRSNSNCLLNLTGSSTTSTLFSITDDINIKSVINITDIYTKGVKRVRFIGKEISDNSSFSKIESLNLQGLRLGTHSIAVNFHADRLNILNIKGGIGVTETDNSSFYLSISPDSSQGSINSSLVINNVYGYSGLEDLDMFFIKGINYKSISITNCTAEGLVLIPNRQGDGFDLDGVGEKAFFNNIRAINCGIEIKYAGTSKLNSNYNLIGNNIISTRGSISLRCGGTFNNVISDKPVTTGLIIAGYSGSEDLNKAYLTVNNVSVLFDSNGPISAAPVTIAMPNISIKGLTVMPHIDDPNAIAPAGIRISSCKNVSIDGLLIKNTPQIVTTPTGQTIDNLSLRNITAINTRDRGFDFGESTNLSNSSFSNLSIQDYQASYSNLFQIRSTQVLNNIRISNFPYTWYGSFKILTIFKSFCQNFIIDNYGWDTTDNTGNPIISTAWGVGTVIQKTIDNSMWLRISSSGSPSSAYKKINADNATTSVSGVVKQSNISADSAPYPSATYTQSEIQAILAELRDLKTKLRTAGILAT